MSSPEQSLLVVTASPRGEHSVSNWLIAAYVESWIEAHLGGVVVTRDLVRTPPPYVDLAWTRAAYTPPEARSAADLAALAASDELISELRAASRIVIGTPMHNLSIPAVLKAYIDQVVRVGETVSADNAGLLIGKAADIILASGGVYTPGSPTEAYNQASGYLGAVLAWIGITDVSILLAGGVAVCAEGGNDAARFREEAAAAARRHSAPGAAVA